jgi:hypothetical protein
MLLSRVLMASLNARSSDRKNHLHGEEVGNTWLIMRRDDDGPQHGVSGLSLK